MPAQPTLFTPAAPPGRVLFLAGLLKQWELGDRKPHPAQRRALETIAEEALAAAAIVRGMTVPS